MKPFDEKLADNVRETFDNWHEQVPDGAWGKMETKLSGGKKPKVIPFWKQPARVAAISLLAAATVALLMIPLFLLNNKTDSTISPTISQTSEEELFGPDLNEIEAKPTYAQEESSTPSEQATESLEKWQKPTKPKYERSTTMVADLQEEESESKKIEMLQDSELIFEKIETIDEKERAMIAQMDTAEEGEGFEKQKVETTLIVDTADNSIPLDAFPFEISRASRLSWAVSASPLVTFADNQPNPLPGLSAGITAGYQLSDKIRFEVGGLLSYNQLDIENAATFSVVDNFTNLYASQDESTPRLFFSGNNRYSLLALEVPANIQFNVFDSPSSRFFVSTGLSSMVYLHQSVSGFNHIHLESDISGMPSGSVAYSSTTVFVDDSYGPFSRIDLGRILNLSAGYVIVGKSNSIVLEPFLKLPLGSVSSSNLSLGMGGLNLKLLFSGN